MDVVISDDWTNNIWYALQFSGDGRINGHVCSHFTNFDVNYKDIYRYI
jgi:hypothetical protein